MSENSSEFGSSQYQDFEDRLHLKSLTTKRMVEATTNFMSVRGLGKKVTPEQFHRVWSFNNGVCVFKPDLKKSEAFVVKTFSGEWDSKERYLRETKGREFIVETGLFSKGTGIVVKPVEFKDDKNVTIFTKRVTNIDPAWGFFDQKGNSNLATRLIVDFLVRLNEIKSSVENLDKFPYRSKYSAESPYIMYKNALEALVNFRKWLKEEGKDRLEIKEFLKRNEILKRLDTGFDRATRLIDPSVMHEEIPPDDLRFNWGDVSVTNLMFSQKKDGRTVLYPFDLEYCGWDGPSGGLLSIVLHHQSEDIKEPFKKILVDLFIRNSRLNKEQIEKLDAMLIVGELLFLTRKLTGVTRPALETPMMHIQRQPYQTWSSVKIEYFLEPLVRRLTNPPLRAIKA